MFPVGDRSIAHFLFEDGPAAHVALIAADVEVEACREVLVSRLNQNEPGQLGGFRRAMANAGVNIEILYSDHEHQMVVVVDDQEKGQQVCNEWMSRDQRSAR